MLSPIAMLNHLIFVLSITKTKTQKRFYCIKSVGCACWFPPVTCGNSPNFLCTKLVVYLTPLCRRGLSHNLRK